ncbi:MAG: serine/threonine-protein kinase [Verrucomicrobia bacterium]|nr:serine/threonine-protein kinase [Verrucomicrobiota bacterium]
MKFHPGFDSIVSVPLEKQFGVFKILAPLGAGGMGEVYRAHDTRLGREVAIKVLPKEFAADADRLRRFEQEAKTLATLNHPNIMTVFAVGQHEGAPYLVSELLEGQTLRDALKNGPLTPRKAIEYALQVAQGLAAAHGKSVIHRDLKPENLFVTQEGRVKILDFGLAKLKESPKSQIPNPKSIDADAPTVVASVANESTEPGRVMGTPGYMAPEQVRGAATDQRTDIFAFGAVLYEMLAGQRAFKRGTSVETMHAILTEEPPDLSESNSNLPPALNRILQRCLEKKPERRFQTASDLAFALENLSGSTSATARALSGKATARWLSSERLAWATAVLLLTLIALVVVSRRREPPVAQPQLRLSIAPPAESHIDDFVLSPDGRYLAFTTLTSNKRLLMIRTLASDETRVVPEVEDALEPFWSPDSRYVGFYEGLIAGAAHAQGRTQCAQRMIRFHGFNALVAVAHVVETMPNVFFRMSRWWRNWRFSRSS